MDVNDYLTPAQLASFLGVRERTTRGILAELEALGFRLEQGAHGARLCPAKLAAAIKATRTQQREVASLRLDPGLNGFLARDARGVEPDPLDVLLYTATEVAVVREAVGALTAAAGGLVGGDYRAPA